MIAKDAFPFCFSLCTLCSRWFRLSDDYGILFSVSSVISVVEESKGGRNCRSLTAF